jgi:hypothetical protein
MAGDMCALDSERAEQRHHVVDAACDGVLLDRVRLVRLSTASSTPSPGSRRIVRST